MSGDYTTVRRRGGACSIDKELERKREREIRSQL